MAAGQEIGALFVRIGADVTGLKAGLNQGEKDVTSFTGKVNSGIASLAKVGASLGGIGIGIAAFAASAFLKTEALGQAAFDMGEKFGMSGGEASKWIAIAEQLGISNETVGIGFKFISKNMGDIQLALSNGHKPAALLTEAFDSLGVKLYDANGKLRSTTDVMNQVADQFAKMPDGAMKTAAAVAIFGRSGSDLIPLLNEGSAGLASMTAKGKELGTVMSTKQVDAAHKAYLAHKQFDAALEGIVNRIGIDLMPTATALFTLFVTKGVPVIEDFGKKIQSLKPDLQKACDIVKAIGPYIGIVGVAWVAWNVALAVTKAMSFVTFLVQMIAQSYIAASATEGMSVAQWLLNLAMDANPIGAVVIAIAALAAGFYYAYTHSKPFHDFVNALWDDLKRFGSWLGNTLGPIIKDIGDAIGAVGKGLSGIGTAAHNAHIPGFATGGIVPGAIGAPTLAVVHGGERVLTPAQQRAGLGGGSDSSGIIARLDQLIAVVTAPPGGQTGVEAALYKATSLAGVNRARGMAGA